MNHPKVGVKGKIEVTPRDRPGTLTERIPIGWFSRQEVATKIGKSRDTVKRWHNNGIFEASAYMRLGKLVVWLYSESDVRRMQQIAETIKPGPDPNIWP